MVPAMTDDKPIAATSLCEVAGCTDTATRSRWVVAGMTREVQVCEKHEVGELTIEDFQQDWGE